MGKEGKGVAQFGLCGEKGYRGHGNKRRNGRVRVGTSEYRIGVGKRHRRVHVHSRLKDTAGQGGYVSED